MSFIVNEEEWEILFNEPPELFKVYCALRKDMDIATGITGIKKRISEQYIKEVLYVDKVQGRALSKQEKTTRETIRSIIKRLEKLGLITNVGPFVFLLNLAVTDKYIQNNNNQTTTMTTTMTTTNFKDEELAIQAIGQAEIKRTATVTTTSEILNNNPPPLSVINNKKKPKLTDVNLVKEKIYPHKLPVDFCVTDKHRRYAKKNDLPSPDDEIEKFKNHHIGKGTKWEKWDLAFYNWLRNAKQYQRGGNSNATNKTSGERYWDAVHQRAKSGKIIQGTKV